MTFRGLVWLLVPLAGLVELGAHWYFAERAPRPDDWQNVVPDVERLARPGDLIVIAPSWAEPLGRQALGEGMMPLSDVARAEATGYSHAIELGLFGKRDPELANWIEIEHERSGPFSLRRLLNPQREAVVFSFTEHAEPPFLTVTEWNGEAQHECEYTTKARASSGGLGGHVTYPRERYRCSADPFLVGKTVIDDAQYRPRQCIYAHPPASAWLHLRYPKVPAGKKLRGHAGMSYLIARDGSGTPVEFAVYVDNKEIGRRLFSDSQGFTVFEFPFDSAGRAKVDVTFEVQSKSTTGREFCFSAEMR